MTREIIGGEPSTHCLHSSQGVARAPLGYLGRYTRLLVLSISEALRCKLTKTFRCGLVALSNGTSAGVESTQFELHVERFASLPGFVYWRCRNRVILCGLATWSPFGEVLLQAPASRFCMVSPIRPPEAAIDWAISPRVSGITRSCVRGSGEIRAGVRRPLHGQPSADPVAFRWRCSVGWGLSPGCPNEAFPLGSGLHAAYTVARGGISWPLVPRAHAEHVPSVQDHRMARVWAIKACANFTRSAVVYCVPTIWSHESWLQPMRSWSVPRTV